MHVYGHSDTCLDMKTTRRRRQKRENAGEWSVGGGVAIFGCCEQQPRLVPLMASLGRSGIRTPDLQQVDTLAGGSSFLCPRLMTQERSIVYLYPKNALTWPLDMSLFFFLPSGPATTLGLARSAPARGTRHQLRYFAKRGSSVR